MEPKRELSSVDLAALVGELSGYAGAKVEKAYLYGEDLLRLKLRDFDRGRVELLLEVGAIKRAHVAAPEHVPDAPERPPDFAMMLRNRLAGAELAGVEQFEFDRILSVHFDRGPADRSDDDDGRYGDDDDGRYGDADGHDGSAGGKDGDAGGQGGGDRGAGRRTTIVAELFGDGNVAVLDANGDVVDSLETVRLKSRTVVPGVQYEFPASRVNPLALDREGFAATMAESTTDVVRTLATQLNLGGFWAEELCTRAGVEKTLAIEDADEEAYDALFGAIQRLAERLRAGDLDPRVYYDEDDRPVDVAPLPLEERASLRGEPYDSFNAALDDYFFELERATAEAAGEPERPDFEAEIEKRERIVAQQEGAIEEFEAAAEREREKAELLYAEYELVDEVLSTVRAAREDGVPWVEIEARFEEGAERGIPAAEAVVGVDEREGRVTVALDDHEVELDPSEGVEKNADRCYTEAKRIEDKREGALAAVRDTREELREWRRRREAWEAGEPADEAGDSGEDGGVAGEAEPAERDWLSTSSVPVRSREHWYEQFRWFHTSDGFLVIGGRNAADNEALVGKYLEPGDRFFHVRAHGGPATILKATGPSEPAREVEFPGSSLREAAQFAVSYSSVWKDGRYAGDVYMVEPDQVSKTPESGEYLETGGFAIRGERTYFEDTPVGVAVGIQCEPETRVVGGPPAPVEDRAETSVRVEPGKFAQADVAKRIYRAFRERFADTAFVRKVASPDRIQHFLPPGGSRIVED